MEYDPKTQIQNQPPKKRIKTESKASDTTTPSEDENQDSPNKLGEKESLNWDIDNPYLAATKLPARGND